MRDIRLAVSSCQQLMSDTVYQLLKGVPAGSTTIWSKSACGSLRCHQPKARSVIHFPNCSAIGQAFFVFGAGNTGVLSGHNPSPIAYHALDSFDINLSNMITSTGASNRRMCVCVWTWTNLHCLVFE